MGLTQSLSGICTSFWWFDVPLFNSGGFFFFSTYSMKSARNEHNVINPNLLNINTMPTTFSAVNLVHETASSTKNK